MDLVFARGSGQALDAPEFRRFRDQVNARIDGHLGIHIYELGSASIDGQQYPAVGVGGDSWEHFWNSVGAGLSGGGAFEYGNSVNIGVDELNAYITARAAACPNTTFVLGGYSQGAQVVGETYNEKLTPELRDRIAYQALFGDPKLYLPEGVVHARNVPPQACSGSGYSEWRFDVADCTTYSGSLGARNPYLAPGFTSTTGLSCHHKDFVCGGSRFVGDTAAHLTYADVGSSIDKAAVEIAKRLATKYPDSSVDTVAHHPVARRRVRCSLWVKPVESDLGVEDLVS